MNTTFLKALCFAGVLLSLPGFAAPVQQRKNTSSGACSTSPTHLNPIPDNMITDDFCVGTNAPAAVSMPRGGSVSIDASFIYWYASQDYMDLGRPVQFVSPTASIPAANARIAMQDFQYKPGFKVGFDWNTDFDDWVMSANYLWLHESTDSSFGSVTAPVPGNETWLLNNWFSSFATAGQTQAAQLSSTWTMHLDMADVSIGRPFYVGRRVTVSPFGGVRGLWLKQSLIIDAVNVGNLALSPANSSNYSQSWSVGPNTGTAVRYLLGSGVRLEGDMGFSLLYTRYTTLRHKEFTQPSLTGIASIPGSLNGYSAVRPMAQMGLGLGWGRYFSHNKLHFDFAARYDFTLLWQQNMMRYTAGMLASNSIAYTDPIGDLMLQGLTLNFSLGF